MESPKGDRRIQKVEREMREVLATFAITRLAGRMPALISIPQVQVSRDLRSARVFVQILDKPEKMDEVLESLDRNSFEIGREINNRLHMRYCPKLKFIADRGFESARKIDAILAGIQDSQKC